MVISNYLYMKNPNLPIWGLVALLEVLVSDPDDPPWPEDDFVELVDEVQLWWVPVSELLPESTESM